MAQKKTEPLTWRQREALEAELKRYVAKRGGFRAGISEAQKKRTRDILKKLGRKEVKWAGGN